MQTLVNLLIIIIKVQGRVNGMFLNKPQYHCLQ